MARAGEKWGALSSVLMTLALVVLAARTVSPHAELLRSDPASGSVLPTAPRQIKLWFSEPIEAVPGSIAVTGSDGARVDRASATVSSEDRSLLMVRVDLPTPGAYTVAWRGISADGHPINGRFTFSVEGGTGAIAGAATVEQPTVDSPAVLLQPAGRWLHLLALVTLAGPVVILLLLGQDADPQLIARLWRLAQAGALLALPAAVVMLFAQSVAITGSPAGAVHLQSVVSILKTHWGELWAFRTLVGLLLFGLAMRRAQALVLSVLAIDLLATAMNGHSAATAPVALSLAIDWVHLAATATWAGGLLALSACVLPWARPVDAARRATLVRIVPRFSTIALVSVELLILTGLYHTWAHLAGPEALVSTPYGRALLVKIGLIALTMVPAGMNLLIVRRRAASSSASDRPEAWPRHLTRLVTLEAVLAVAVLGAAALLTSLPDAPDVARPEPVTQAVQPTPRATFVANAGSAYVTMGLSSGTIGSNHVHITVLGRNGEPLPAAAPRLSIEPPGDSGIPGWTVTPEKEADGYAATLDFAPAGQWTIQLAGIGGEKATFSFRIPLRGDAELIALADQAVNGLHSVLEDTTETTPDATEHTRIEYVAPDRLHRKSEGNEEISIGSTRYMHHGATWHPERIEPFRWPRSAMAATARDVILLGTETLDGRECLVVQFVDGASGTYHRLWIATQGWRLLQRTAVSPGRTVVTRYSRFDDQIRIVPPSR